MLTPQKKIVAERLAVECDVPLKFASLVLAIESDDEQVAMGTRKENIVFLEKVINSNWSSECEFEFEAQSLALDMGVPIQMGRMAVTCVAEVGEAEKWKKLKKSIVFLSKIFAFVMDNPNSLI